MANRRTLLLVGVSAGVGLVAGAALAWAGPEGQGVLDKMVFPILSSAGTVLLGWLAEKVFERWRELAKQASKILLYLAGVVAVAGPVFLAFSSAPRLTKVSVAIAVSFSGLVLIAAVLVLGVLMELRLLNWSKYALRQKSIARTYPWFTEKECRNDPNYLDGIWVDIMTATNSLGESLNETSVGRGDSTDRFVSVWVPDMDGEFFVPVAWGPERAKDFWPLVQAMHEGEKHEVSPYRPRLVAKTHAPWWVLASGSLGSASDYDLRQIAAQRPNHTSAWGVIWERRRPPEEGPWGYWSAEVGDPKLRLDPHYTEDWCDHISGERPRVLFLARLELNGKRLGILAVMDRRRPTRRSDEEGVRFDEMTENLVTSYAALLSVALGRLKRLNGRCDAPASDTGADNRKVQG